MFDLDYVLSEREKIIFKNTNQKIPKICTYAERKGKIDIIKKIKKNRPAFGELAFDEYLSESNDFKTGDISIIQSTHFFAIFHVVSNLPHFLSVIR